MKIAYVIEDFYVGGGVERIVSEKANTLSAELGHDVTLITVYRDGRTRSYPLSPGVRLIDLDVPMAARSGNPVLRLFHRAATLARAVSRLNRAVRAVQPDIIFFATTLGALLLPLCRTGARRIFESHSSRRFTPYGRLFFLTERAADGIVCLTGEDARHFGRAGKVVVIPNFISRPSAFVADYGVRRAVAVGRLEHVKGFDRLISCWAEAVRECPGWRLDIYGEGPLRGELQRLIDSSGLGGSVTLCGRSEQMMLAYTRYSLQLVSSRYEGLPMTLIEAQSCGLPAVTFDFEYGARDIVSDGCNGILVPQDDTSSFVRAACRLMSSEPLRREYGERARLTYDRFSKERVMKEWRALIDEQVARS